MIQNRPTEESEKTSAGRRTRGQSVTGAKSLPSLVIQRGGTYRTAPHMTVPDRECLRGLGWSMAQLTGWAPPQGSPARAI